MTRRPWGIDRILWQRCLSTREAWAWFAVLILAPVAMAGGIWLHHKVGQHRGLRIETSRTEAIQRARAYAKSFGVRPDRWTETMWAALDTSLADYIQSQPPERQAALRKMVHPAVLHVRLTSPDETQSTEVVLDENGRPYGLHRKQPARMDTVSRNDPAYARGLAEETMEDCLGPEMEHLAAAAEPEVQRQPDGLDVYKWPVQVPGYPELTLTYTAGVRGLTLMDSTVSPKLDETYQKRIDARDRWQAVFTVLGWLVVVVLSVVVFVRYLQRLSQGEVSKERMLLVSAIIGSCYLLFMVCGDSVIAVSSGGVNQPSLYVILLFGGVIMLLIGAASGVAYAGTEGDLRERYPDKLTSVDCFLLGRWTSRNVGSAIVVGTALAAWVLLVRGALELLIGDFRITSSFAQLVQMIPFSRSPGAMILLNMPTNALLASVFGLLLPRTVSQRLSRNTRTSFFLFLALAYLATASMAERTSSLQTLLVVSLLRVAIMAVAFYTLDFLTCVVIGGVVSSVSLAVGLAQVAPVTQSAAWVSGAVGSIIVLIGFYGVWRGRVVPDDEVRPLYARNVAERLSLQEEVAATREAQARLLPREMPQLPGLTLAAAFQASERVGGDFYDFVPLGPTRAAVLLTEGGGGGLATALAMALTKGYITQKAQSNCSAASILSSLHGALDSTIADGARLTGVFYGVIDSTEGTFTYARMGSWPRVLVVPEGGAAMEKSVSLGTDRSIREATIALRPGMRTLLYTDGLRTQIGGNAEAWLRSKVSPSGHSDADSLQKSLLADLMKQGQRHSQSELVDDITFIVLAMSERQEQAREKVA